MKPIKPPLSYPDPAAVRSESEIVLFAVMGMTPSVLTETIWALAHAKPAVIPHRIVVLTTTYGAGRIKSELFGKPSVWNDLRAALAGQGFAIGNRLRFGTTADDIRVITRSYARSARSRELGDIRSADDNNAVADFILEKLRSFTENPQTRIIASIAGGRKTMSALLYACMSLVGRESDRLTHVLVNAPYDDPCLAPRFYFPLQAAQRLRAPAGKIVSARKARIDIADIPFVPLRNRFLDLADMPGHFSNLVERYSRDLKREPDGPVIIGLEEEGRHLRVDGKSLRLRERTWLSLKFLMYLHAHPPLPVGHPEALDSLRNFLETDPSAYARTWCAKLIVDDLKRELSVLRHAFARAGIAWGPGLRADSLRLPPFTVA